MTIFTIQTIAFAILTIEKKILKTCDIWDTDYNSDNWEPEHMTIFVTWQLIVTLDSIRNSCDVFTNIRQLLAQRQIIMWMKIWWWWWLWEILMTISVFKTLWLKLLPKDNYCRLGLNSSTFISAKAKLSVFLYLAALPPWPTTDWLTGRDIVPNHT